MVSYFKIQIHNYYQIKAGGQVNKCAQGEFLDPWERQETFNAQVYANPCDFVDH